MLVPMSRVLAQRLSALTRLPIMRASPIQKISVRYTASENVYDVVPRRAFLYLPGHDERKATKAVSLGVDSICLDCEDAVAAERKEDARQGIVNILQTINFGQSEVAVRINSAQTEAASLDLKAIFSSKKLPDAIVVPKVNDTTDLEWLFEKVERLRSKSSLHKDSPPLRLITQCETAIGLLNLRQICEMDSEEVSESLCLSHQAIIFGGDDFAANIGATRSDGASELMYARQAVVAHAKAFNLQAIDIVRINYKDLAGLKEEAVAGALMGFTGKQIIHPLQAEVVQEAFTPSEARIERARRILSSFIAFKNLGAGAFSMDGLMIDMPTILQAHNVIKLARVAGKIPADDLKDIDALLVQPPVERKKRNLD
eukprot:m.222046 g.222046  ORF g.222046 m.222046 type:complete len:371 (-) comp54171_c1_seq1:860-1972(-)